VTPERASWNLSGNPGAAGPKFISTGVILQSLNVLELYLREEWRLQSGTISIFAGMIRDRLATHGVNLAAGSDTPICEDQFLIPDREERGHEAAVRKALEKYSGSADVVLVILPNDNENLYAAIKKFGDTRGTKTICCLSHKVDKTVKSTDLQYCSNIALKFQFKLGGDTHWLNGDTLNILRSGEGDMANSIVMGADVTHPKSGAPSGCPSIATVVGSLDKHFVKYPGSMRLQAARQEVSHAVCTV
jgi:hypothetical protein